MKVHTIEIAAAIEEEFKKFLSDWGGGYPMRFTRFVDLGGKQTDLYVYPADRDAPPWMIVRIKSVFKTDQGECIQYFVDIVDSEKSMDQVMVSPEIWKLPAMADKVLGFSRNELLQVVSQAGIAIEEGGQAELERSAESQMSPETTEEVEEDEYEDIDTSGILASGDDAPKMDFNPEDVFAAANSQGGDEDMDPSELLKQLGEESDSEEDEDDEKA